MGSALSSTTDKKRYSQLNEESLNSLVEFIKRIVREYPDESNVLFKQPIKWTSPTPIQSFNHLCASTATLVRSYSCVSNIHNVLQRVWHRIYFKNGGWNSVYENQECMFASA